MVKAAHLSAASRRTASPQRGGLILSWLLFTCLGASACFSSFVPEEETTADDGRVERQVTRRHLVTATAVDGEAIDVACEPGAEEICNALDDNCDGVVDEGCGLGTGVLQVTATWNSDADIDLYVEDPRSEVVSFQRRRSQSGGHLDVDSRGACAEDMVHTRIENAVWVADAIPGTYSVALQYLFECNTAAGGTTATVTVTVSGEVVGTWNQFITPNESAEVVRFRIE